MIRLKRVLTMVAILLGGSLLCASGAAAVGFAPTPGSPLTGLGPDGRGAVAADFDGDGYDDVVSVSASEAPTFSGGGIYMLINDGNGNLTETATSACNQSEPSPCPNDWPIAGVYTADFDQDDNPDVLTIRQGLDRYTVWRGDGDGHLSYGGSLNPARPLAGVAALAIGDLTQDGYPDIAVGYDGGDFGVHPNMGELGPGMFSSAAPPVQSITGAGANDDDFFGSVAIGDFNGGGVDIAFGQVACDRAGEPGCATPYPSSNAVFVADGDGSPINFIGASGNPHPVPTGQVITEVETIPNPGDRDGLAAATAVPVSETELDGQIHTFVGNTNLTLVPNPSGNGIISTDLPPLSLTAGSLDGDDLRDLTWIDGWYKAGVALQASDGGFELDSGSPFYVSDDVASYTVSMGTFNASGTTGLAFGGVDQDTQTGAVSIFVAADDFSADPVLDFGSVETGTTKTLPLTISNGGVFSQWLIGQEITDDASGAFSISDHSNCQEFGMEPQTTCTIMVTFAPATVGSHSAKVSVERDGPGVESVLSGTGTDPNSLGPGPGPGPDPLTKVGLKLTSAKKIKAGKKLKIKVAVKNTGNQPIKGLVLRAAVPKRLAKRPKRATLGAIAPGATVRRTIVVKVKPKAKRGKKLVVKVRANLTGKTLASARKVVKIKR